MSARAVRIVGKGGPEVLTLGELEVRSPGPGEVLVDVQASGLNRADCLQRKGVYPAPRGTVPDVPGLEYAGQVLECGHGTQRFSPGDRVMGIVAGGGMATRVVVHERECLKIPERVSTADAAALPEVFLTAFDALVVQGGLRSSERVLVHAVGSGIGTAAVQLIRVLGATSIGTSRTAAKLEACVSLGLDHAIHTAGGAFATEVKALGGANLVLDTIGAKYLGENIDAMAPGGRMVVIGLLGGVSAELSLAKLLAKRLNVQGSVLRSRPLEEKIALARRAEAELGPLFDEGALVPVVDRVMPIEDIAEAHRAMEAGETTGKVVLTWDSR